MKCVSCLQGLNWECRHRGNCGDGTTSIISEAIGSLTPNVSDPDPDEFTTYKDDSVLRDQQSTGRKRAAKMYPLDEHAPCEWSMKKNAGGGEFPIVGCLSNKQQARHHGPDKNTLNNESGNVHRICHTCHNRWHTLNDPTYVWEGLKEPHSPTEASLEEVAMNEVFWDGRKLSKPED